MLILMQGLHECMCVCVCVLNKARCAMLSNDTICKCVCKVATDECKLLQCESCLLDVQ